MTKAFDKLAQDIQGFASEECERHEFYMYEPWDVEKRDEWTLKRAIRDGVDLYSPDFVKHVGVDPHPFQAGFALSGAFMDILIAGSQVGKSRAILQDAVTALTGEIPFAMRYEKGVDTKVKRKISSANILRWGRFDSSSGKFLDHDINAPRPTSWKEWDCGNIIGVGLYPQHKIADLGDQVWIGTFMKSMETMWWPRLTDPKQSLIPPHLIDSSKTAISKQERTIRLTRGDLLVITFESGYQRFEARKVKRICLDEEPPDEKVVQAAIQHCEFLSIAMTPYNGITYMKKMIFPDTPSPELKVFHASQYDSPYQSRAEIEMKRNKMKPWDINARVWGIFAEQVGKPYFEDQYGKIHLWIQRCISRPKLVAFRPEISYDGIVSRTEGSVGLMDVKVLVDPKPQEDRQFVWRMYEDRLPGTPYILCADPSEGAKNPDDAADFCAAVIMRAPKGKEKKPIIVCTIRSTIETIPFSRICSYALRYYNNALLVAETARAACNGIFGNELKDYPYWYKMTTVQDKTGKSREQNGFNPSSTSRPMIYSYIGDWISEFGEDDYPFIPDEDILRELCAMIVGKNGRPDHPKNGSLDSVTCLGIGCYVFRNSANQIRFNGETVDTEQSSPFERFRRLVTPAKKAQPKFMPNPAWR